MKIEAKKSKTTTQTTEVAKREPIEINTVTGDGLMGGWTAQDLSIPELKCVNPMSKFDEEFPNGALVHDGSVVVSKGNEERMTFYPLSMDKGYEIIAPMQDETPYQYWASQNDIPKGWIQQRYPNYDSDGNINSYYPVAKIVMLIPVSDEFAHYEFDGQGYCKTMFTAHKKAYDAVAKKIFTAGVPINGQHWLNRWEIGTNKKENDKGKWWEVVGFSKGKTDAKTLEFLQSEVLI